MRLKDGQNCFTSDETLGRIRAFREGKSEIPAQAPSS